MSIGFFTSEKTNRDGELSRIFCFSPGVMVGTFSLELILAAYVMYRYGMNRFNRLIVLLLLLLAMFQISEYQICTGSSSVIWGRIAFFATALMPPLGLHIISVVLGKRWYAGLAYIFGVLFAGFFAFIPGSVSGAMCGGNYVSFSTTHPEFYALYGLYYFLFLVWGVVLSFAERRSLPHEVRRLLRWIGVGYLSFMLPTVIVYFIFPYSRPGLGSILCGFAVLMALIVAFFVVPGYARLSAANKSS